MKAFFAWLSLASFMAMVPGASAAPPDPSMQAQAAKQMSATPFFKKTLKPNEMKVGSLTCSGIAVQLIKTRDPLPLINPLAPAKYGSGRDNVAFSLFTRRASGLKVLSVAF